MLIWFITIVIIAVVSLVLTLRSMRTYDDLEKNFVPQGLFLIRNLGEISEDFLLKIHTYAVSQNLFITFEKLSKGAESALVLYGPLDLPKFFPDLDLLELEDYLTHGSSVPNKTSPSQILGFEIPISEKQGFVRCSFLHELELAPEEQFYWQVVLKPLPLPQNEEVAHPNPHFQAEIRAIAVGETAQERVDIAKKILPSLVRDFGFDEPPRPVNSAELFKEYVNRTFPLVSRVDFFLNSQEVLALMDL